MYAVRRTGENREGTQRSTWGSNAPRIIGWASAALCAVAVLSLAASTSRPMQLAETFSQLGNATNATDQATAPAGAKKEVAEVQHTPDGCVIPYIPHSIQLEEDFWAFLHTVRITSEDSKHRNLGYVQSHPFSMTNAQSWYDANGRQVATSHRDVVSLVATIYVGDCRGESLAVVGEQLVASPSSSVTLITVKDESGAELARSEASTQFENQLHVTDMVSGKQVATIRQRPGWTDYWDINLPSGAETSLAADPRLMVMSVAAESSSVAFGFGALPFLLLLITFVVVVAALCFNMARHSDANDPRYGLFAMFDGEDRSGYAEISERDRVVRV